MAITPKYNPAQLDFFDRLDAEPSKVVDTPALKEYDFYTINSNEWSSLSFDVLIELRVKLEKEIKELERRLFDANRTNDDMRHDYLIDLNDLKSKLDSLKSDIDDREKLNAIQAVAKCSSSKILADISTADLD